MKRETAERLAATATEGVTIDQAKAVIGEYHAQLARCPVCDGTGVYTYRKADTTHKIAAGDTTVCPTCQGAKRDPDWVTWHCALGKDQGSCESFQTGGDKCGHDDCGPRVGVPLPTGP